MRSTSTNDNHSARDRSSPEPCGHAAMLLVESLIHGMVDQSLITVADAVEIVDIAKEVGAEDYADSSSTPSPSTVALLTKLGQSLRADLHVR